MRSNGMGVRFAASVAVASLVGVGAARMHAADRSETLVYAVYDGQDTAGGVYKSMKSAQHDTGERIESYAVVSKDLKGKVRIRDQRSRDSSVGAVLGGVIGLVGGCRGRRPGRRRGRVPDR
jgi:hypothetical protein